MMMIRVKLLIISDIHANLEALQAALAESHDELCSRDFFPTAVSNLRYSES
jgi:hypothetical protein